MICLPLTQCGSPCRTGRHGHTANEREREGKQFYKCTCIGSTTNFVQIYTLATDVNVQCTKVHYFTNVCVCLCTEEALTINEIIIEMVHVCIVCLALLSVVFCCVVNG